MSMRLLKPEINLYVLSHGRALPPEPAVSNLELLKRHPDSSHTPEPVLQELANRITRQFGFENRYLTRAPAQNSSHEEETSETLAVQAIRSAIRPKELKSLEAFVLGSTTSCRYTGSQACAVLGKLGVQAPAFEVRAGCSTSLASLTMGYSLIVFGYSNVLVSCAETLSKLIHPKIRETWFGLGDGGAALWLGKKRKKRSDLGVKIEKALYSTQGKHVDLYTTPGVLPPVTSEIDAGNYFISGDSSRLRALALEHYLQMLDTLLSGKERQKIDWIIPHQVNLGLIEEVKKKSGVSGEIVWNAKEIGNIGGASVIYSLSHAIERKLFKKGQRVLLTSVGGGLSYASQIWKIQ